MQPESGPGRLYSVGIRTWGQALGQRVAILGVLVLAVAASACSPSGGASSSGEGETLASFMGWDEADAEGRWREQEAEVQERIRTCMAEQGFEYTPVDHAEGSVILYDAEEEDEEERIREQGFGITTWYGKEAEAFEEPVDEAMEDPNWERVEAMTESERQAYFEALHGSEEEQLEHATTEYDPETGEETGLVYESFGAGCEGAAHEAVYGRNTELWEELGPAFDALQERVEADPRIIERNEEWSQCMAAAGYLYATPQEMHDAVYEEFQQRLDDILGPDGGWSDPFEGWSEAEIEAFFDEKTEDEIEAFFRQAEQEHSETVDSEALSELQAEEIALALADYECRDGDAFWALYQQVSEEYEADFIDENRELLERVRDAEGG
jgi:hypothetical protein